MKKFFQNIYIHLAVFFILSFVFLVFPSEIFAAKRIEIDLSEQRLYAYEDDKLIYNFLVSSGKFAPTPTGVFKPWAKVRSQRMTGGNKKLGTFYDLPNVPYIVYFYQGYAIHGAYWHNNFGAPMSHGCVNVHPANMAPLYNWIEMDTAISIRA